MRNTTLFPLVLLASACLVATACSNTPKAPTPPPAPTRTVDAATAATIAGKVVFTGVAPKIVILRMGIDQACVVGSGPNPQSDAVLVGADGALKNVFVYVKDAMSDYAFPVPAEPAIINQKGCFYTPRVLGVRAGQPLEVLNSDATLHNVHALPMNNREFNTGTPRKGDRTRTTFTAPEVMVRFKCDVHGWMAAHVGVMSHPFFAVTGDDGAFELKGLPPGTYTLEAWHERFGTRTMQVTLGERATSGVSFTFTAG